MVDRMDPQITLTTSNDPSLPFNVSRSALIVHSRFFADMFSLDLKSDSTSLQLDETEKELRPFLLLIQGQEEELEKTLSGLDEEGWEAFAKLSDKYDSPSCRSKVQTKIWEIEATAGSAAFSFTLATLIGDDRLIVYTSKRAVKIPDLRVASFHAAQKRKERLAAWRTMKAARDLLALQQASKDPPIHNGWCQKASCPPNAFWEKACANALNHYNILRSQPVAFVKFLEDSPCCMAFAESAKVRALRCERETSEWPNFPIKGLTFGTIENGLMWKC